MAIARVQGNAFDQSSNSGTIAVTISAVGSGNCVCGMVAWDSSAVTLSSVTDNQSNTYNLETRVVDGGDQCVVAFSRTNITNAPITITANFSGTPSFRKIIVDEFSGISAVSSDQRDGSAHGGQTQETPGTGTNAITSGTFTTATNGDLLYGTTMGSTTTTLASNGTSFSTGTSQNDNYSGQTEYRVQTTAGSGTAATFTQAAGARRATFLIAIKPAAAATTDGVGSTTGAGTASATGTPISVLTPDADITDGSWLTDTGGTSLFAAIDEAVASDTDYIVSGSPDTDMCEIRLSDAGMTVARPFSVAYRYKRIGSDTPTLRVQLMEGATSRASWDVAVSNSTFTNGEQFLTAPEFASIVDFTDLRVRFTAIRESTLGLEGDFSGDLTLEGDFSGSLLLEGS